ncbi:MAG: cyclic nucleotide-binding domain-containing protein [Sphingopyxis sp.]
MISAYLPYLLPLALGAAVLASMVAGGRWIRIGLSVAGLLFAFDSWANGRGWSALILALMLALGNGLAVLAPMLRRKAASAEARQLHARHLSALPLADVQLLIDQGSAAQGRTGDVLTREGQAVNALQFLMVGSAAVQVADTLVGRVGPGDLIGEACMIEDGTASATVCVTDDSAQLWFIPRDRLRAFLAVQPRIAQALSAASLAALRDKLESANMARAEV